MDFHAMKRKRLQSLCKKHGIPANLKNKEMADRLSLILKGKENDVSCHSSSHNAGTDQGDFQCVSGKDLLSEQGCELNSNNGNNLQMVASDTVAGNVDAREEEYFVNSGKRSAGPNLEERVDFSPKLLKNSEIERLEPETNLSPEITRDDVEICDAEENMQDGDNKEQVDESQEGLHSTSTPGVVVMNDVDLVQDATGEFDDHLEEAEVEKLVENIDVHDHVCGTGKGGDEVEAQDDINSPQGSNIKDLSPLLVSPDEYDQPLGEEVQKSNDNVCVNGAYTIVSKEQADDRAFGNYLVEGEVEKLGDKTDAQEKICGTRKCGAESDKQDDTNSLQGSDLNDKNLPHVSLEESGYPLVRGEAQKSDEPICFHGGVYNYKNFGSEVDTMYFVDTSTAAKDSNGKINVTKHFPDEVHSSIFECSDSDQSLTTNPLSEAKSSYLNIHQMVVSDVGEANIESSSKKSVSPDSEKIVGFYPDLLDDLETKGLELETNLSPERPKDDIESFDVEENMQCGVNKDCVQDSQEVLHAAPSELVMNNADLVQVSSEEFDNHLIQREFEKLVDQNDLNEDIYGTGKGGVEDEKQYETNSPQGSNINDVNQEEPGYPLVEGEDQKSDETICAHGGVYSFRNSGDEFDNMCFVNTSISAKDTNRNTNMTMEHFSDEVHSSNFKYADGASDPFLTTNPLSEAKSTDINIHQFVVSVTAAGSVDEWEARFVSSPKISSSSVSEKIIGLSSSFLNDLENKVLELETNLPPETQKDDVEMCDVEENMQSDVDKDHEVDNQEVLHAAPSTMVMNNVDLLQVSPEVFGNGMHQEESDCHLVGGEVRKSDDPIEAERNDETNGPQGSIINDVNQEESGDTNCVHGGVCNIKNSGFELDNMCLLDTSITAKNADENTNVAVEDFLDQVHSSNLEYSDGMPDLFPATYPLSEVKSSDFNIHGKVASDTTEEKLESSKKKGLVADPKECIEFCSMHLEASEFKDFEIETSFSPNTLGDIVGTCNIRESMQSVKTGTVSGGEDMYHEKLGSSLPKRTPVASSKRRNNSFPKLLESSMMKENINTAKKEQLGSTIAKKTFPMRQPLQDLQQN